MRTTSGGPRERRGRLSKALQFAEAAEIVGVLADEASDLDDAFVTLCVHGGIAAADAICIRELGEYSRGENHADALSLLRKAEKTLERHLATLLAMKTKAGYSFLPVSADDRRRAARALHALIDAAR